MRSALPARGSNDARADSHSENRAGSLKYRKIVAGRAAITTDSSKSKLVC
jgi:hypothetical protein